MSKTTLIKEAIELLQALIATPSVSREEDKSAALIMNFLQAKDIEVEQIKNNVWARSKNYDPQKKTLLLNSHHDTVKPAAGYTRNPYDPVIEDGRLYGLGSNDAGGALVSLISTFVYFHEMILPFNLVLLCSAEEEVSGTEGIALAIGHIPRPEVAIIGEPTSMDMAIAEKGLLVLDCLAHGKSGHAARDEGENALYKAIDDINRLRSFRFDKVSELLGPVKMTTTMIEAGTQHNVVPDHCAFTVDVRTTDAYTNREILDILQADLASEVTPRSLRLNPSKITPDHPLVKAGLALGLKTYGSPTLSDQSLIDIPSLKLGPGDSRRSHTADEYIYVKQLEEGIETYINLLSNLKNI